MLNKHDLSKNSFIDISERDSGKLYYQIFQMKIGLTIAKSAAIVELYTDLRQALSLEEGIVYQKLSDVLEHYFASKEAGADLFSTILLKNEAFLECEVDLLLEFINTLEYNLGIDRHFIPQILNVLV